MSSYHVVASELKDPICHSNECQIGSFSSEATMFPSDKNANCVTSFKIYSRDIFGLNPYNAELFLYNSWRPKGFFTFEIIINVLVNFSRLHLKSLVMVLLHRISTETVDKHQTALVSAQKWWTNTKPPLDQHRDDGQTPNNHRISTETVDKHQTTIGSGQRRWTNTIPPYDQDRDGGQTPNNHGISTETVDKHQTAIGSGQTLQRQRQAVVSYDHIKHVKC